MSEDLVSQVTEAVARIQQLELTEQPEEFARLRDQLEQALESVSQAENQ